ncbi:CMGC/CK2 protein kinase [Thecamonas trahens ATCC 50062]|uniref:non-specific serine/threonine protein kinase n=1 Tax=Thecamonas trahens ATCC 50062 TaxID=461836 RepID=A0A0L0D3Z2_THETB|nr:CMGC/CK2 protein kinase [Thecamonas trahens ATCC 50062]KNC46028.1 CMGC/CK2 protein kinase [Thecamonas trahens ATCC 50062]|eukprot:XP_013763008.1 CMGC/CK2 protein kinase [Thecamonas trahens ATCC 50062]
MTEQRVFEAREHADYTERFDRAEFDVKRYRVTWTKTDRFKMGRKVGQGHFGEVFEAKDTQRKSKKVVAKMLKDTRKQKAKLRQEIKMLEYVRGGPNIVQLQDTVKDLNTGNKLLIFEKINYVKCRDLFPQLDNEEVRYYAYELLRAIAYTHSIGVMHRDIKPSNILIDPRKRKLRLIDWGKNIRGPGTRCYKSPELSLRYEYYDYSCDMWAFGCTFGSMIFLEHPLIRGKGSWFNQLLATVKIVGSDELFTYMRKINVVLDDDQMAALSGYPKKKWESFIDDDNRHRVTPEAIDLIANCVLTDHVRRFTATEAMAHPYFDAVRPSSSSASSSRTHRHSKRNAADSAGSSSDSGRGGPAKPDVASGSYSYYYESTYQYVSYTGSSSSSDDAPKARTGKSSRAGSSRASSSRPSKSASKAASKASKSRRR